jgi:hypothetical protein
MVAPAKALLEPLEGTRWVVRQWHQQTRGGKEDRRPYPVREPGRAGPPVGPASVRMGVEWDWRETLGDTRAVERTGGSGQGSLPIRGVDGYSLAPTRRSRPSRRRPRANPDSTIVACGSLLPGPYVSPRCWLEPQTKTAARQSSDSRATLATNDLRCSSALLLCRASKPSGSIAPTAGQSRMRSSTRSCQTGRGDARPPAPPQRHHLTRHDPSDMRICCCLAWPDRHLC